jgi:hypothetical protein
MTIATIGHNILASAFMGLRNRIDTVLHDLGANVQKGYGNSLTAITPATIVAGVPVTAAHWNALRTDINKVQSHQTGAAFSNGSLPAITSVTKITAATVNLYDAAMTTIEANTFLADAGSMTIANLGSAVSNTNTWGPAGTDTLTQDATITFTTYSNTRYYFNSGGELRLTVTHADTSTPANNFWHNLLSASGTISMKATSTSATGTGSTFGIGYYGLTTAFQTIYSNTITGSSGSGYYGGTDYYQVQAKINIAGSQISLRVILIDAVNEVAENVANGTSVQYSYKKAVTYLTEETPGISNSSWVVS